MDAINKASSAMEAGLSAGLSAATKTTNLGLSAVTNTTNLTKIVAAKTVTLSATASYGAYHGSKEVGTAIFSSMAEQIPGYEKHSTTEETVKEKPPPVMAGTAWEPSKLESIKEYTPERELDVLFTEVEQEITRLVQAAGASTASSSSRQTRPPMHLPYLRSMSCVLIPVQSGEKEQTETWTADDFKTLRERCSKVGKRERVAESMHDMVHKYLEGMQGKEAIMAGLNLRQTMVDKHQFYSSAAFERGDDYEVWKDREMDTVESQKIILKRYTKNEVIATIFEIKMGKGGVDQEDLVAAATAELSAEDRRRIKAIEEEWNTFQDPDEPMSVKEEIKEEIKAGMYSMFGKAKAFINPIKSVTKQVLVPVTTAAKTTVSISTGGMVTGQMIDKLAEISKQQVVGKALCWVTITFGEHGHSTEQLPVPTTGDEAIKFHEGHVQWHLSPGERGAFKVQIYRKSKFGLSSDLKGKDEVVGTVVIHWDELAHSGETRQAIERWFECEEESSRQVKCSVHLVTTPISGSESPIFDPSDNLLAVFTDMYTALCGPETTMVRTPAIDWLLEQMRIRCGVGTEWERILGLKHGLLLEIGEDLTPEAHRAIKEGRMLRLLECIRMGPAVPAHTTAERALVHKELRMICKQLRNQIITFPFKLARGCDEEVDEPVVLALLVELEEEVCKEIERFAKQPPPIKRIPRVGGPTPKAVTLPPPKPKAPGPAPSQVASNDVGSLIMGIGDDAFAAFDSTSSIMNLEVSRPVQPQAPPRVELSKVEAAIAAAKFQSPDLQANRNDILKIGLMRFASAYYGDEVAAALRKCGMALPGAGGQLGCKQVKRVAKRVHIIITRLVENFGGVLPHELLVMTVAKFIDLLTVDVAGIIAAYHIRCQMHPEFEDAFDEGSDEQLLLKLHHRANMILLTVKEIDDSIDVLGLATATGPVLKAWIDNMRRIMYTWIETSTASEKWERIGEESYHTHSVIDVFASAHQSVETFAALKMGQDSSVRNSFLKCLGQVCCKYMECMKVAGQKEQDILAAAAKKKAEKTGSYAGMMSHMGGGVLQDIMISKSDLQKMTQILTGGGGDEVAGSDSSGEGIGKKDGGKGGNWSEKGSNLMDSMEHGFDAVTDVGKWGSGLKSLGSKSLKASMSITKKTVNVAASATVKTVNVAASATAKTVNVVSMGAVNLDHNHEILASSGPPRIFHPKDFYDGSQLVSEAGCTRMTNACKVKEQMDNMVTRLEAAEKEHGVSTANDWTLSDQVTKAYEKIKVSIQGTFELELGPLLRQVHNGIRAALTEQGGTPPVGTDPMRKAIESSRYEVGMEIVRGPDWKWGNQDGGKDSNGKVPVGKVIEVKKNKWIKVRWPSGTEESYRVGHDGMCDVMPFGLDAPEEDLAPALQAIVDALDNNLGILRNGLDDRNFATCLRITWLSSIDVLQEVINDDISGDVNIVRRANSVLRQLRNYMHADGAGVPQNLIDRSSDALQKMLDATLM